MDTLWIFEAGARLPNRGQGKILHSVRFNLNRCRRGAFLGQSPRGPATHPHSNSRVMLQAARLQIEHLEHDGPVLVVIPR